MAALALVVFLTTAGPAAARPSSPPAPGAAGIGDRLFPTLGNGGYDARHYRLSLTYATSAAQQEVQGEVAMRARASQSLSSFNLDFADGSVSGVEVNGRDATFTLADGELVVTPRRPIREGRRFDARVEFTAAPDVPVDDLPFGWFTTNTGSVTAGQPDQGHTIYPVNDHPADKATYTIKLDVPEGDTAVASGELQRQRTRGGRSLSVYVMDQPMASELTQVAVGDDLRVIERGRVRGVEIRDVAAEACADEAEPLLARTPDQMRWLSDRAGRYPFANYGVLAADQNFGYALETQTLSLHPCFLLDPAQFPNAELAETILVHELAHQWYGDSVAPEAWSDVWLNEGHATWYEWTYGDEVFGGDFALLPRLQAAYEQSDRWRAQYGPVALPASNDLFDLFSPNVYDGGALVLYTLRQVIGDTAFRRLEREWAQRYEGESVGTEDFIALASSVARRDLGPFLRDWLYGTETPAMPGHPDWEVLPLEETAPAPQSRSQALAAERSLRRY